MQPGHFLDVLHTPDGEPIVLLIHAGFDQATAAFNAWAPEVGRPASAAEGIDMPASSSGHFWGLDPAQATGERILRGAAALIKRAFCRRELLLERCGEAFANIFGQRIRLRHISNWAHSLLAVDHDAIHYQQGAQVVEAGSQFNDGQAGNYPEYLTELAITGGPLASTWLIAIPPGPTLLLPHGRCYVDEAPLAETAPEPPLLVGRLNWCRAEVGTCSGANVAEHARNHGFEQHAHSHGIRGYTHDARWQPRRVGPRRKESLWPHCGR